MLSISINPVYRVRREISRHGFTLIELLVAISIGAILLTIAVPSFTTMIENNRLAAEVNMLVSSLNYARSEVIKQDNPAGVAVIPTANTWSSGWSVCCASGGANNLQTVGALTGGITMSAQYRSSAVAVGSIVFGPNGALTGAFADDVVFTFCDVRGGGFAREIEVDIVGRIQSSPTPGKRVDGTALTCP